MKGRHPLEPDPAGESAVEEKVGIAASRENSSLKEILETQRKDVAACQKGRRKIEVEPEILAVDHRNGAPIDPEVAEAVEALAPKSPGARPLRRGREVEFSSICSLARVTTMAWLIGVRSIPTVGEIDCLATVPTALQPATAHPTLREVPAHAEVDTFSEGSLDHRVSW
jgi:hypothetical protein